MFSRDTKLKFLENFSRIFRHKQKFENFKTLFETFPDLQKVDLLKDF